MGCARLGAEPLRRQPVLHTVAEYNAKTGALIDSSFVTGLLKPQNLAFSSNSLYVTT